MSHFRLGVIIPEHVYSEIYDDSKESIEKAEELTNRYLEEAMAPYAEDCEARFLSETDITEEILSGYTSITVNRILMPDGSVLTPEEGTIMRDATEEEAELLNSTFTDGRYSYILSIERGKDGIRVQVPIENGTRIKIPLYTIESLRTYVTEDYGTTELLVVNGDERHYYHAEGAPIFRILNSEIVDTIWTDNISEDEIYERLEGSFTYTEFMNPHPKWDYWRVISFKDKNSNETIGPIPTIDGKLVSACQICDLALEYPWTEEDEKRNRAFWEIASGEREITEKEKHDYNFLIIYNSDYYKEFYGTYEKFRKESRTFSTYALLSEKDGWIEPGEVGWFGSSTETPESKNEFNKYFEKTMKNANPRDVLVALDCHI